MSNILDYLKKDIKALQKISKEEIKKVIEDKSDLEIYPLIAKLSYPEFLYYIKDDELRIECFLEFNNSDVYVDHDAILFDLVQKIDVSKRINYITNFKIALYRTRLILELENDQTKMSYIESIDNNHYRNEVLKTITNDDLLYEYYMNDHMGVETALLFKSDKYKELILNNYSINKQALLIESFKSDLLKEKYINNSQFDFYKVNIVSSLKDDNLIIKYFNESDLISFKIKLIQKIGNVSLQNKLINLMSDSVYKQILKSNDKENKKNILKNVNLNNIDFSIDQNISIGIELESCNILSSNILLLKNVLNNWKIKPDTSLKSGFEISSPILHYTINDLRELYYICSLLNNNGCYVNNTCGGHIHLGFDYFKTVLEFETFLNIYANVEDILYVISNKSGIKCRPSVFKYAMRTKNVLSHISRLEVNYKKFESLDGYAEFVRRNQPTRYYGLNFQNIGSTFKNTIEFRIPNGEIDFNEIVYNINLFTNMFSKAKMIANNQSYELFSKYNVLINNKLNNKDKVRVLLDLLFDSEDDKQIYQDRYNNNSNLINRISRQKVIKL